MCARFLGDSQMDWKIIDSYQHCRENNKNALPFGAILYEKAIHPRRSNCHYDITGHLEDLCRRRAQGIDNIISPSLVGNKDIQG
jgi:hypothetical protein